MWHQGWYSDVEEMVVKCLWSGGESLLHFSTCCKSLVSQMLLTVPKQTAIIWPQTNWTCDRFKRYGRQVNTRSCSQVTTWTSEVQAPDTRVPCKNPRQNKVLCIKMSFLSFCVERLTTSLLSAYYL